MDLTHKIFTQIADHILNADRGVVDTLNAGFRIEEKEADDAYPNGWCLIYRNIDDKLIGRMERWDDGTWAARYWFFGGGTTFCGFPTRWVAAMWVLLQNSELDDGWDE